MQEYLLSLTFDGAPDLTEVFFANTLVMATLCAQFKYPTLKGVNLLGLGR